MLRVQQQRDVPMCDIPCPPAKSRTANHYHSSGNLPVARPTASGEASRRWELADVTGAAFPSVVHIPAVELHELGPINVAFFVAEVLGELKGKPIQERGFSVRSFSVQPVGQKYLRFR